MKIAIPLADGRLSMHFGHCRQFAIVEADPNGKEILNTEIHDAPPHQPGLLPRWLGEKDVNLVITGGMGQRAQAIFTDAGIEVLVGAPCAEPQKLVRGYLEGTLQTGDNVCDH